MSAAARNLFRVLRERDRCDGEMILRWVVLNQRAREAAAWLIADGSYK